MPRKISIYYKGKDGRTHYLSSTNQFTTVKEAVKSYKDILKSASKYPQTRRAILRELRLHERSGKPELKRIFGRIQK